MKKLFIAFTLGTLCIRVFSFTDNTPFGARSSALSNATVAISDMWSVHHNQAGLSEANEIAAGISYENRFMLSQLGIKSAALVVPVKTGGFGLSVVSLGYSGYTETKYGLSYGQKLGDIFSVGIQIAYFQTKISENYGTRGVVEGEIGFRIKLSDKLTLASHIFNISKAKLTTYNDERLPTIIRFGGLYSFSKKVFVSGEIEKDILKNPIAKIGLEYQLSDIFCLRTGVSSVPFSYTFGFGLKIKRFNLDFSSATHYVLGYSPQLSISYRLKK